MGSKAEIVGRFNERFLELDELPHAGHRNFLGGGGELKRGGLVFPELHGPGADGGEVVAVVEEQVLFVRQLEIVSFYDQIVVAVGGIGDVAAKIIGEQRVGADDGFLRPLAVGGGGELGQGAELGLVDQGVMDAVGPGLESDAQSGGGVGIDVEIDAADGDLLAEIAGQLIGQIAEGGGRAA